MRWGVKGGRGEGKVGCVPRSRAQMKGASQGLWGETEGDWGAAGVCKPCVGDKDSRWEGSGCQWKKNYGWKGKGQEDIAGITKFSVDFSSSLTSSSSPQVCVSW